MSDKKADTSNKKVFLITSNQSKLDNDIKYSIIEHGTINLKIIFSKCIKYKREDFTINVLSFEVDPKNLSEKDKDKDKNSKKFIAKVELKQKKIVSQEKYHFLKTEIILFMILNLMKLMGG